MGAARVLTGSPGDELRSQYLVTSAVARLRIFFRYDRTLLGKLSACAWRAMKLSFQDVYQDESITPGAVEKRILIRSGRPFSTGTSTVDVLW